MKSTIVSLVLLALALPSFAQKAKPVDAVIKMVQDRRNADFGQLALTLELPSVLSGDVASTRVHVLSAVDDLGTSLLVEGADPGFEQNISAQYGGDEDRKQPASISVGLVNPPRAASKLTEVRGEVDLFMPAKDPNGVASIAKFRGAGGKPLAHKALKANGVEITILSDAQLDAARKKLSEAKRQELAGYGYEGESLEESVKQYSDSLFMLSESDFVVSVKDPQKRIHDIAVVTAEGEPKRLMPEEIGDYIKYSTWGDPIGDDWTLQISMQTPKNMVKYAFAVKDVELP